MSREKTFIIVLDDLPAKLSYANYGNININTPEPLFTNHSRIGTHKYARIGAMTILTDYLTDNFLFNLTCAELKKMP